MTIPQEKSVIRPAVSTSQAIAQAKTLRLALELDSYRIHFRVSPINAGN